MYSATVHPLLLLGSRCSWACEHNRSYDVVRRLSGTGNRFRKRDAETTSETLADRHKVIERQSNPEICLKLRCPLHECPAHLFLSLWR
jgi:hypothetical protein